MQLFSQVQKSFCREGRSELSSQRTVDVGARDRLKPELNLFGEILEFGGGLQGFSDLSVPTSPLSSHTSIFLPPLLVPLCSSVSLLLSPQRFQSDSCLGVGW